MSVTDIRYLIWDLTSLSHSFIRNNGMYVSNGHKHTIILQITAPMSVPSSNPKGNQAYSLLSEQSGIYIKKGR
jgi:hypothetical protein